MLEKQNAAAQVARLREMAKEELETISEVNENESGYKQGCPAHVRLMELKERSGLANAALSAAADALEREAGLVADVERWKSNADSIWMAGEENRKQANAEILKLKAALRRIKGPDNEPDADGLIDDETCSYCDANSVDGCNEDCPRAIAAEALSSARGAK